MTPAIVVLGHNGFELARLSDDFFGHVRQHIRAGVIRMSNPLDMGDIFDIDSYAGIVEKALAEDGVDGEIIDRAPRGGERST